MPAPLIASHNILSPLGFSTDENFSAVRNGKSGLALQASSPTSNTPFCAALINTDKLDMAFQAIGNPNKYTRFEKLLILSISHALKDSEVDIRSEQTGILISTTKGNIDLLDAENYHGFGENRIHLWEAAQQVQAFFENPNVPIVLSNACISGALAVIMASDYIRSGRYNNIVVAGADIISKFVVSGFQSFLALAENPCQPYDKNRNGLNLGEGCGTIVLTNNKKAGLDGELIAVAGGASSNDANHISGPSRTGAGLTLAIGKSLKNAGISAGDVNYLCAHGTATIFNDEMESLAFSTAGLSATPVNSFKGYYGHTLGAAGLIESVLTVKSMTEKLLVKTAGYTDCGVSGKINVITENTQANIHHAMKTASGFGGCNAALIFSKLS
ncbi:MAG TPA: beta-ketoacyl synthase [Flavobacteriales bacterium]|nr:beta-ketoacyl synthase [Flavobacteriales bacterium]